MCRKLTVTFTIYADLHTTIQCVPFSFNTLSFRTCNLAVIICEQATVSYCPRQFLPHLVFVHIYLTAPFITLQQ